MQHVTALEDLRLAQPASLTIGAFDGVHRGHRALIGSLVAEAHAAGRAAVEAYARARAEMPDDDEGRMIEIVSRPK